MKVGQSYFSRNRAEQNLKNYSCCYEYCSIYQIVYTIRAWRNW